MPASGTTAGAPTGSPAGTPTGIDVNSLVNSFQAGAEKYFTSKSIQNLANDSNNLADFLIANASEYVKDEKELEKLNQISGKTNGGLILTKLFSRKYVEAMSKIKSGINSVGSDLVSQATVKANTIFQKANNFFILDTNLQNKFLNYLKSDVSVEGINNLSRGTSADLLRVLMNLNDGKSIPRKNKELPKLNEKKWTKEMIDFAQRYESGNYDVSELIWFLQQLPTADMIKVVKSISPEFSIDTLFRAGIIDDKFIGERIDEAHKELKVSLPKKKRAELIQDFKLSSTLINASNLDESQLRTMFAKNKQTPLTSEGNVFVAETVKYLEKFANVRKQTSSEFEEKAIEKYDKNGENMHQAFLDLMQEENISPELKKQIKDNFHVGGFFAVNDKNGNPLHLFRIREINVGSTKFYKKIVFEDLINALGRNFYVTPGNGRSADYTYPDVRNLLVNMDSDKNLKTRIISPEEFENFTKESKLVKNEENILLDGKQLELKLSEIERENFGKAEENISVKPGETSFVGEDGVTYNLTVLNESRKTVTIESGSIKEEIPFEIFLKAYKKARLKRIKTLKSAEDFKNAVANVGGDNDFFAKNKIEIIDGKLIQKKVEGDIEKTIEVKGLQSKDGDVIQFRTFKNSELDYSIGKTDRDLKDQKGLNSITWKHKSRSLTQLFQDTKNLKELKVIDTVSKISAKDKKTGEEVKDIAHVGSSNSFFKWYSVYTIIGGFSTAGEQIMNYLKYGDDLKQAELAHSLLSMFPGMSGLKMDSKSRLDLKKIEEIENLAKRFASGLKAADREKLTIDALQGSKDYYTMTALMLAQLSKTGSLYAKGIGKKFKQNEFIWYRRFGGEIGDAKFLEFKAKADAAGMPIDETKLVEERFKIIEESGALPQNTNKKIGKYVKTGIEEEKADGEGKAKDIGNGPGRVEYVMDMLRGGEIANAIGAIQPALDKNPADKYLRKMFAVIALSVAQEFTGEQFTNFLMGFAFGGESYPEAFYSTSKSRSITYANFFKKVIEDSDLSEKRKGDLITLFNQSTDYNSFLGNRVRSAEKLWDAVSQEGLLDTINLSDGRVVAKKDKYSEFKEIIELGQAVHSDGTFKIDDGKLNDDTYLDHAVGALATGKNSQFLNVRIGQSGAFEGNSQKKVELFLERARKNYASNSSLSYEEKFKAILELVGPVLFNIVDYAGHFRIPKNINDPIEVAKKKEEIRTWSSSQFFRSRYGFSFYDGIDVSGENGGYSPEFKSWLDNAVHSIISRSGETNNFSVTKTNTSTGVGNALSLDAYKEKSEDFRVKYNVQVGNTNKVVSQINDVMKNNRVARKSQVDNPNISDDGGSDDGGDDLGSDGGGE